MGKWAGVESHLKKLDVLQKKILKILLGKSSRYSSETLSKESKLLDLRQLYFLRTVVKQHKNRTKLNYVNHKHNTRLKANAQYVQQKQSFREHIFTLQTASTIAYL
jgi:hypothetical protein